MNEAFDIEGYPIWVEESDAVSFEAKRRKIRSLAAVEAAQETHSKKKHPEKGVRFYAEAKLKPGRKWPSRADWLKRQSGEAVGGDDMDIKAKKRAVEAEERAAAKVAQNPDVQRIVDEVQAKLQERAGRLDQ